MLYMTWKKVTETFCSLVWVSLRFPSPYEQIYSLTPHLNSHVRLVHVEHDLDLVGSP